MITTNNRYKMSYRGIGDQSTASVNRNQHVGINKHNGVYQSFITSHYPTTKLLPQFAHLCLKPACSVIRLFSFPLSLCSFPLSLCSFPLSLCSFPLSLCSFPLSLYLFSHRLRSLGRLSSGPFVRRYSILLRLCSVPLRLVCPSLSLYIYNQLKT